MYGYKNYTPADWIMLMICFTSCLVVLHQLDVI